MTRKPPLFIRDDPRRSPSQWTEVANADTKQSVATFAERKDAEEYVALVGGKISL